MQLRTVEAQRPRDLLQRGQRVVDVDERASGPGFGRSREFVVDERDVRAGCERGLDEIVTVAGVPERNETGAGTEHPRIESPGVDGGALVSDDAARRPARDLRGGEHRHEHASSSSIATTRSSKGIVTPAAVCPVS